jgi:hypothetical protein
MTAAAPSMPPPIATGFVRKLYRILDQESGVAISWDASGASFSIHDGNALDRLVLPRYFRGRLFAFRQQLREHGFQRLGGSVSGNAETYAHESFLRGCPERLSAIVHTPQPRRRPPRRKASPGKAKAMTAKPASGAASVVLPSKVFKGCHRVKPYPVSASDCNPRERGPPPDLANNPLFASDECSALADFLSPMSIDNVKHSLDFAVASDACTDPLTQPPGDKLSDETMGRLMRLLADSRSTDEVSGASVAKSSSNGRNIFEPSDPTPVVLPPTVTPAVMESLQFSADTIDMMMHWLSREDAAKLGQ